MPGPSTRSRPLAPLVAARGDAVPPGATRLPLSALRARLDVGSAGGEWSLHGRRGDARVLTVPAGGVVTFPLRLAAAATLTARVALPPGEWSHRRGAVRTRAVVTGDDGERRVLWSRTLRTGEAAGARGHRLAVTVPASSTALTLTVEAVSSDGPVPRRAMWVDPMLVTDELGDPPAPQAGPGRDGAGALRVGGGSMPLISVLTPVHDPPLDMLQQAIASVTSQTWPHWELCLCDDGSTDPAVIAALQHHAASDPRIHLARHDTAQGISAATNHAMALASGDYIALLDHDDTLTPDALATVAQHITADPTLDMLYSDEDIVGEDGARLDSHPKPGWSPDHMALLMYTCHLGVYRRSLAEAVGGFRSRFDGCQDYDFVLRLIERTDRVQHIPRTLYHWRAHATSTASGDEAKPFAYVSQPGAISEHLRRVGVAAEVQYGSHPGMHRIVHRVDPKITVDLATHISTLDGLTDAAHSWAQQPHPNYQLTLTAPEHLHDQITTTLLNAGIPQNRITLTDPGTTNPHHALATATELGASEHILIMTSPAQGLTHDWLTRLIGYSHQPGIAAAAPIVLAPDGRIQHAGIAMPHGIPLHILHGLSGTYAPPVAFNALAASGVMMIARGRLAASGGLDPELGELSPIGVSLSATADGIERITVVPDVRLRTTGPDPTVNDLAAIARLRDVWGRTHGRDPYHNPRWRTDRADFILA